MKQRSIANFDHLDARRICIIKPSALGDVVQATSVLGPLRRRFPQARVSWVIKESLQSLLGRHPQIDDLILYPDGGGWRRTWQTLRELRRRRFDLVLDLQGLLRSGVMTWATRARWRIGMETSREGAAASYNGVLSETGWNLSAHGRICRVAEAAGARGPLAPQFPVPPSDAAWARQRLAALPRPLLAVSPGTRWQTKQWPAENFAAVARQAVLQRACGVVLIGSRGEQQLAAPVERAVLEAGGQAANLSAGTSLPQLAAALQESDCLLSNDSGAMHLAAAVGTPVVSVFTSTTAELSGPADGGPAARLISTAAPCGGCYKKKCPLAAGQLNCLDRVDQQRVAEAVVELLGRERRRLPAC